MSARVALAATVALLTALIVLGLAWELFLAPLRPGGSWLVLKVLPLLVPLFGLLRGKRYTYQWSSLLIWAYFAEGATRMVSDPGPSARYALAEAALSFAFFGAAIAYLRASRTS